MDRPVRLNWGCGPVPADGWTNVDNAYADPLIRLDYTDRPRVHHSTFEFRDATFDGIVANHSLQCLVYSDLDSQVREFHRLLRVGGRLRVIVPDVVGAFEAYLDDSPTIAARWPGFVAISEDWSIDRKFAHYLTWGGQNRTTFTEGTLIEMLEDNGFEPVFPVLDTDGIAWASFAWLRELDSRLGESVVVEVKKP